MKLGSKDRIFAQSFYFVDYDAYQNNATYSLVKTGIGNLELWEEYARDVICVDIVDAIAPKSTRAWFQNFISCKYFYLTKLDMSKCNDTSYMFSQGTKISRGPSAIMAFFEGIEDWDVSNVADMSYMFYNFNAKEFTSVNFKKWNTKSVKNHENFNKNAVSGIGEPTWVND